MRPQRIQSQRTATTIFPEAFITTDYREILKRENIEVVDITPHPTDRIPIIEAAIAAGKHILSQKPFVTDLDEGERLIELADKRGVKLAVNQNGRWSPHFSYIRQAISAGLIGEVVSANFTLHWDHNWIIGTPFEEIHDLILYDFGVHWFDLARVFSGIVKRKSAGFHRARHRAKSETADAGQRHH